MVFGNTIDNTSTTGSKFKINGSATSTTYESFLQFNRPDILNVRGPCADIGLYRFDNTLGFANSVLDIRLAYQNGNVPDLNILTLSSFNGGRVGINQTSPKSRLHITGSVNNSTPNVLATNNPPESILKLYRPGNGGTTFGSTVEFNVSRNQNAGANAGSNGGASVLDIKMTQVGEEPDTTVATFFANGRVGINQTSPTTTLDVNGTATIRGAAKVNTLTVNGASGLAVLDVTGFSMFRGAASNGDALNIMAGLPSNETACFAPMLSGNTFYLFGKHLGTKYRYTVASNGSFFTGHHANKFIEDEQSVKSEISNYIGLIVSSADVGYYSVNPITKAKYVNKSAITITESLPIIKLSRVYKDKSVWGVITNNANENYNPDGSISYDNSQEWGSNLEDRIRVNGLGEGAIWVCNANGNIENGDYITSCTVPGYGTRQDTEFLANYTVAKATCSVIFTNLTTLDEKFQIRFLRPGGNIITRDKYEIALTNNQTVYISVFIGCTYHCS